MSTRWVSINQWVCYPSFSPPHACHFYALSDKFHPIFAKIDLPHSDDFDAIGIAASDQFVHVTVMSQPHHSGVTVKHCKIDQFVCYPRWRLTVWVVWPDTSRRWRRWLSSLSSIRRCLRDLRSALLAEFSFTARQVSLVWCMTSHDSANPQIYPSNVL